MRSRVRVAFEVMPRRTFVIALDWPGWARSGKTEEAAMEAFLHAAPRYAPIAARAGETFDAVAAAAPEALRKGPRGGGRDRSGIVEHVNGADEAYARTMGITTRGLDIAGTRAAMLALIRTPSDGSPLGGRKWPVRYAARRIAWHALDHAWEIEDRTDPA
jgi:hypothetical protein